MKSTTYHTGLFPLSADPITFGHLELMRTASEQCKELIVLIANNDDKLSHYTFTLDERTNMTERAVHDAGLQNIRVLQTTGLLTDVFMREHCDVVFRGVRHVNDATTERELAALYGHIYPVILDKFIFLPTPEAFRHVSSSWVKHFVRLGVDVSPYVPLFIKALLEERLNAQIKIGITGTIAVGKSFIATQLVKQLQDQGQPAHHISADKLLHQVYAEASPGAQTVRDALAQKFGDAVLSSDRRLVNRPVLAQHLFADTTGPIGIGWVQQLVLPHVERLYRQAIAGLTGFIIVEWAQFVEMDMLNWVNNNIILVRSDERSAFAAQRALSADYVTGAARLQFDPDQKQTGIEHAITQQHYGRCIHYKNSTTNSPATIEQLARDVLGTSAAHCRITVG